MKKKIFAAICSVTMLAGAAGIAPAQFAAEPAGITAEAANYTFSAADGQAWYNFTFTNGYNSNDGFKITSCQPYQATTTLSFPDYLSDNQGHAGNITALGDNILKQNTRITSITVPNTVRKIGDYFCNDATNLVSATLSNNLETLGRYCFYGNPKMTSFVCNSQNIFSFGYGTLWANKWADSFNQNNTTALIIGNMLFRYYKRPTSGTLNWYSIKGRRQLNQSESYYAVTSINDFAFAADAFPTSYAHVIDRLNLTGVRYCGYHAFWKFKQGTVIVIDGDVINRSCLISALGSGCVLEWVNP